MQCCKAGGAGLLPGALIQKLLLGCLLPGLEGSLHRQASQGCNNMGTIKQMQISL